MTSWNERMCERCQTRAVGVRGRDPHLCADCNMEVADALDALDRSVAAAGRRRSPAAILIEILEQMDETIDSREMSVYDEEIAVSWRNDLAQFYMDHYYDGAPDGWKGGRMPVFSERP